MPRNRLEELQALSKHAPVTEEEEMKPLNEAAKKSKAGKAVPAGAGDDFQTFLSRMQEVVEATDSVEKNVLELRSLQKQLLQSARRDETGEARADDLTEENKRLAQKIRSVLKAEQEWVEKKAKEQESGPTLSPTRKKMNAQAVREWQMRKTQV